MTESTFPASLLALALAQQSPEFVAEALQAKARGSAKTPPAADPLPVVKARDAAPIRPTLRLKRRTPLHSSH